MSQQGFAPVGAATIATAGLLSTLDRRRRGLRVIYSMRRFLAWLTAFEVWLMLLLILFPSPIANISAYSSLLCLISAVAGAQLLSDAATARAAARTLVLIVSVLGYSGLITWLLILIGVPVSRLSLMHITLYESWSPDSATSILFPISVEAGNIRLMDVVLPRCTGAMREPGLCQLVSIILLVTARRLKCRRWLTGGLVASVFVSGSTAALVSLVAAVVAQLLVSGNTSSPFRRYSRLLGALLISVAGIWAVIYIPSVGVADKAEQSGSVAARHDAILNGFNSVLHAPFGRGLGHSTGDLGINLIGMMTSFGVPGLILIAGTFLAMSRMRGPGYRQTVVISTVVVITGLTSQPLLNMAGLYLVMLVGCAVLSTNSDGDTIGQPPPNSKPMSIEYQENSLRASVRTSEYRT